MNYGDSDPKALLGDVLGEIITCCERIKEMKEDLAHLSTTLEQFQNTFMSVSVDMVESVKKTTIENFSNQFENQVAALEKVLEKRIAMIATEIQKDQNPKSFWQRFFKRA